MFVLNVFLSVSTVMTPLGDLDDRGKVNFLGNRLRTLEQNSVLLCPGWLNGAV